MSKKLCIVLVGLPARGKSFVAGRLLEGLEADGINTQVFNNGILRRELAGPASVSADFYSPDNEEGRKLREHIAKLNMNAALEYLAGPGQVAILDATNSSEKRRKHIREGMAAHHILFIECINNDPELLSASIRSKGLLPEFAQMGLDEGMRSFRKRIAYYESIYTPVSTEKCFVRVETLNNRIIEEHSCSHVPYYTQIRDILISDWVRNMYLARHGESQYNLDQRIGGNSALTPQGHQQAAALAKHFADKDIPYIFTSTKLRSSQTAAPIIANHPNSIVVALEELDEIDAGVCDSMTYDEIRQEMPAEFAARAKDKYGYVYPEGEGYSTLKERVARGFRKAMFLSGAAPGIIIIGHQAINRTILSLFLYRRNDAVPYIYVPQNEYFHIVATHRKKLLELVRFTE